MPFLSTVVGNVYVVRWEAPTALDVRAMEVEVSAFHREVVKMHGLAIVPANTSPPDDATRKAMGRSMQTLLEHLETIHTVIEGSGFKHTILRSVMTGVTLVGGKRGRVFTHSTIPEAIQALSPLCGRSTMQLTNGLEAGQMFG